MAASRSCDGRARNFFHLLLQIYSEPSEPYLSAAFPYIIMRLTFAHPLYAVLIEYRLRSACFRSRATEIGSSKHGLRMEFLAIAAGFTRSKQRTPLHRFEETSKQILTWMLEQPLVSAPFCRLCLQQGRHPTPNVPWLDAFFILLFFCFLLNDK